MNVVPRAKISLNPLSKFRGPLVGFGSRLILVRDLFTSEGRPSTEHICQYSSTKRLLALGRSACGCV